MVQVKVRHDYISTNQNVFNKRSVNFMNKVDGYAESLSWGAEEVSAIKNALTEAHSAWVSKNEMQKESQKATVLFGQKRETATKAIREFRNYVVNKMDCSSDVLQDLGLQSSISFVDTADLKPALKVSLQGEVPAIHYNRNHCDAIKLYSRINRTGEFELLETISKTKFTDLRPTQNGALTEIREYYAIYVYKGDVVGKSSEVVQVTISKKA